jgi:hypothetical protein
MSAYHQLSASVEYNIPIIAKLQIAAKKKPITMRFINIRVLSD